MFSAVDRVCGKDKGQEWESLDLRFPSKDVAFGLLERRAFWSLFRPQLLHCPQYPPPHRTAVQVGRLKHGIRPHGGLDRRVLAVALHEDLGGAVDVEVEDHCRRNVCTQLAHSSSP